MITSNLIAPGYGTLSVLRFYCKPFSKFSHKLSSILQWHVLHGLGKRTKFQDLFLFLKISVKNLHWNKYRKFHFLDVFNMVGIMSHVPTWFLFQMYSQEKVKLLNKSLHNISESEK